MNSSLKNRHKQSAPPTHRTITLEASKSSSKYFFQTFRDKYLNLFAMIKEMIRMFPLSFEEKLNDLLLSAEPRDTKAFHLYKLCQFDGAWSKDFSSFKDLLFDFYSLRPSERCKSILDRNLDRPVTSTLYDSLQLNFRSGHIAEKNLKSLSNWAHNLLRVYFKQPTEIFANDILHDSLLRLTNPNFEDKDSNIRFPDFCNTWKQSINKIHGNRLDRDLAYVHKELLWYYEQNTLEAEDLKQARLIPTLYLTQTEITWVEDVLRTTKNDQEIPRFPLSRGLDKQRLIELNRTISLFKIIQNSKSPDFQQHRLNIKTTIIARCEEILRDCMR